MCYIIAVAAIFLNSEKLTKTGELDWLLKWTVKMKFAQQCCSPTDTWKLYVATLWVLEIGASLMRNAFALQPALVFHKHIVSGNQLEALFNTAVKAH